MENASDALKMAAAMLLFVGALSVAILVLSKARQASANIMSKKDASRSYYSVENLSDEKEVGLDTVIANMYNYYQTQSTILFYKKVGNTLEPITLYYTEASDITNSGKGSNISTLDKSTLRVGDSGNDKRAIYGIDIHDELTRQEPWTRNEQTAKQFIDALVNRKETPGYDISVRSVNVPDYNKFSAKQFFMNFAYGFNDEKPLISMAGSTFIERIGIYNYEAFYNYEEVNEYGTTYTQGTFDRTETDSSVISFDETDETIENNKNEKKTVIEYIYIPN